MNIAILIPGLKKGGAERVAAYLTNYLSTRYEVTLITFDKETKDYFISEKVKIKTIYSHETSQVTSVLKRICKLKKIIKNNEIDVLLTFFVKPTFYGLFAKNRKTKIIFCERTNPFYNTYSQLTKKLISIFMKRVDHFIFMTEGVKEYYSKYIDDNYSIIPNGVFIDYKNDISFVERNPNKIVAVGRFNKVKDYPTLIKSFQIIAHENSDYYLEIFGVGLEKEAIKQLAIDLKVDNRIYFKGKVDDIQKHIKDASLFIQTSLSESWGNSIMEAMALGIPVISTDCDFGPREMIKDGINGFLAPLRDYEYIGKIGKKILTDKDLAKTISENALNITKQFKIEEVTEKYEMVIKEVVNKDDK